MQGVCFNCFHYAPEGKPCPYCGYDASGDAGKYRLALQPGTILTNRYLVGRVLGQGGFGITYVALDNNTKSRVALKEYMPTDFAFRDEGTVDLKLNSDAVQEDYEYGKQQFLAEAETLAEFVGNEHIITIRDRFEANGTAYFAMEYAEGVDLKRYMEQKGGPLRIYEANRILLPIMEALQWVHSKGIVHRDISPDNIMIRKDGNAKLIDFGAARYSTGEKSKSLDVVLKHGFAPVEQYSRRGRQGPFTDVYAMAATYYYAITGKVPPDAVDRMSEDELQPPSALGVNIKEDTEQVLMKALALNAPDRWQTMAAFYSALLQTMPQPFEPGAGEGTGTKKKPAAPKEKKPEPKTAAQKPTTVENKAPAKKKPTAVIAAVLVLAVLLGVVFGTGVLKKSPAAEETEAPAETEAVPEETSTAAPEEIPGKEDASEAETAAEAPALKITAIDVGLRHTVALREDGTVAAVGDNSSGQCNVSDWKDVAAIAARGDGTYGICRDGTVLATGGGAPYRVEGWKDISAIAAGSNHVLGIKPDGTVTAGGGNMDGQCDVSEWKDITEAACGAWCSLGLKKDGTVVAAGTVYGYRSDGNTRTPIGDDEAAFREIAAWKDIVCIHAGTQVVYGVSSDGTIHAAGIQNRGVLRDWTDIVSLTGTASLAGLKSDGTVVIEDSYDGSYLKRDVEDWKDIVSIAAGDGHLVGLKSDGTVVAVGKNDYGQCDLQALSRKNTADDLETESDNRFETGNIVTFGSYEQDNNMANGPEPIEWIVLDADGSRALLISRCVLDCVPYNNTQTDMVWENCSLREWLHSSFEVAAFGTEEMNRIILGKTDNSAGQNYDGFGNTRDTESYSTDDRIFALSYQEAWAFFGENGDRTARPTEYALARGSYADKESGNSWWWLRSPGKFSYNAADVNESGYVNSDRVDRSDIGVRPAVWIKLD